MSRFKVILVTAVFALSGAVAVLAPAQAKAATTTKPCTHRVFKNGSVNECVASIQTMLNLVNKANLQVDRKFGSKTKTAVRAWQTTNKIYVDGVVGPETWGTLCSVSDGFDVAYKAHKVWVGCGDQLSCVERKFSTSTNSRAHCVVHIQTMLNLANNAGLSTDSKFGSKTRSAVVAWQKKHKTTDKKMLVDGIVGPQTWKKLCDHKMSNSSAQATYDTQRHDVGCQ
jgi:peptidoglycan hydrolase-like protein with peptidoglycan-binding domain